MPAKIFIEDGHFEAGKKQVKDEEMKNEYKGRIPVDKAVNHDQQRENEKLERGSSHESPDKLLRTAAGFGDDQVNHNGCQDKKSEDEPA